MKQLISHRDGFDLNQSIIVEALDEPGPGGALHEYRISIPHAPDAKTSYVGKSYTTTLRFQKGPRNEEGSLPGITEGALLAVLIDRLEAFQLGPYWCVENDHVLQSLRQALDWTKRRAANRHRRGVLGTTKV